MNAENLNCENCGERSICRKNGTYLCETCDELDEKTKEELYSHCLPSIDQITEKIFLGNSDTAMYKDILKSAGITHILICGFELRAMFPGEFVYYKIPLMDDEEEDVLKYFVETNEFIEKSEKIYIHCAAGISRSSTITIAYLMMKENFTFSQASEFVRSKRKIVNPNSGFVKQLLEYEVNLAKK